VNILLLILWGSGLIYGIIFSVIQSSFTKQILLKNEFGLALMLSGEAVKEKIKGSGEDFKEKIKKENVLKKLFKQ
jgi:hypothetical protein